MTEILHSTTFPKIYQNSDLYQESCIYIPILKKNVAKFCILQLLLETQLEKDLTALQLLRVLHGIIIISNFQEGLQPGLFSENLVFGEISHFTTFARILVFSPKKRAGQFYPCFNITQCHYNVNTSQKICNCHYFQKIQYFAKFRIL